MAVDKDEIDHYEVLGLVFSSSTPVTSSAIKKAFRKQAKILHPDKNKDLDQVKAAEQFHILNTAYETLTDEEKRKEYDQKCSSKMKRKRQLAEMDEQMRKKRNDLEARESEAKRRKLSGYLSESDIVAHRKQSIRLDNLQVQKVLEEEEKNRLKARQSEEFSSNNNSNQAILRVSWGGRIQEYGRDYSREDLSSLFSRWGVVVNVVVGGKKTAVVEMENPNVQALDALIKKTATTGPFKVSWKKRMGGGGGGGGGGGEKGKMSKEEHDSLEASVLKRMLSGASVGKE